MFLFNKIVCLQETGVEITFQKYSADASVYRAHWPKARLFQIRVLHVARPSMVSAHKAQFISFLEYQVSKDASFPESLAMLDQDFGIHMSMCTDVRQPQVPQEHWSVAWYVVGGLTETQFLLCMLDTYVAWRMSSALDETLPMTQKVMLKHSGSDIIAAVGLSKFEMRWGSFNVQRQVLLPMAAVASPTYGKKTLLLTFKY